ncbi:MAG: AIR synthase-related protein, partial [Candidatus Saccharimonadales bacterium]
VANAFRTKGGKSYYDQIAQDTVAMIVNDLIVVGALPQVVNAYWAVGDSAWLSDEARSSDLIKGWAAACQESGAAWGGGETPTLVGTIAPDTIDLAGSAIGIINPKERLVLGDKLAAGDAIVLIESSGIHANGLTLARKLADQAPDGYHTKLADGRSYGQALLAPTHLYIKLVRSLMEAKLDLHYMVNITGHGWRKLMRANQDFKYVMNFVPKPQAEFDFIQKQSGSSDEDMYGNFNMGAGFAVYLPANQAAQVVKLAKAAGLKAWDAGRVLSGPKQVVIEPKGLSFSGDSLGVRS